jgi:hypothetical protein
VYFILKNAEVDQPVSKLLIEQEVIIESIATFHKFSMVKLNQTSEGNLFSAEMLKRLGINLKK